VPNHCWHPRLTADGLDDLVLSPENGWRVEIIDIGSPVMAEVTSDRPDADGRIDQTLYFRDRAVTLRAHLLPEDQIIRRTTLDGLKRFLSPRLRPYLILTEDESDTTERRIRLRANQWSEPITAAGFRTVQISWVAPDGIVEAAVEQSASAFASGSGSELGITFDGVTFDGLTFPTSPIIGSTQVVNNGTTDVWPLIRIYGLCTEPNIENQTTGKKLEFNSLTINAGEFLEIDTRNKTVRYQGLSTDSRYDKVDFAVSAPGLDLRIVPGLNQFRFYPATNGATSVAEITWRSAWL